MPSALSRRLEARKLAMDAHLARPDLVGYQDDRPELVLDNGQLRVDVKPIPGNVLKLNSLSGIGDAIWCRAIVKETIKASLDVLLQTDHPWAFHDMAGMKGFAFYDGREGVYCRGATYLGEDLKGKGVSVFKAMCDRCHVSLGDFSLPVHPDWAAAADELVARIKPAKPVMVYRPLLHNHGRRSVASRNPDHAAYSAIFKSIRSRYHVISVATDGAGENIVHADQADSVFHKGEIAVTTLMALMARAALVYTNAGMALVAGSALGAPVLAVMGGYEGSANYNDTAGVYGPALLIDPIEPCYCLADNHACKKAVDVPAAIKRAKEFCDGLDNH